MLTACAGYKAGAKEMQERWIMWLLWSRRCISGCSSRDQAEPTIGAAMRRRRRDGIIARPSARLSGDGFSGWLPCEIQTL